MTLFVALLLGGCASGPTASMGDDSGDSDASSLDTATEDAGTSPTFRLVVEPADAYVDGLRILPQAYGPYLAGSGFELVLRPAVAVRGHVEATSLTPWGVLPLPTEQVDVAGALAFRSPDLPDALAAGSSRAGDFEVELLPGELAVDVVPDRADLPTTTVAAIVGGDGALRLSLGLGTALWGRLLDAEATPVVGGAVWAERDDGLATSTAVTDEAGWYQIRVGPGTWRVASGGAPGGRDPVLHSDPLELGDDGKRVDLAFADVARRDLTLRVVDGSGAGVADVPVRLSSTVLDGYALGRASYELDARTDSRGDLTLRAPSGVYRLDVLPAADQPLATLRVDDLDLGDDLSLGDLPLASLVDAVVSVIDPLQTPLPGARVQCTEAPPAGRTTVQSSEADGTARLPLAPTRHTCLVQPPPDRPDLAPARFEAEDPTQGLVVRLGPGTLVQGTVRLALPGGAEPAAWAVVRVLDEQGAAVGFGLTDQDGVFEARFQAAQRLDP